MLKVEWELAMNNSWDDENASLQEFLERRMDRERTFTKEFNLDRMNFSYEHYPMNRCGDTSGANYLISATNAFSKRQWDQNPFHNHDKRKTRFNPNTKALED